MSYQSELYAWRKEHHICVHCGKQPAFGKYVRCAECIEKYVGYYPMDKTNAKHREGYQKRKAAGLCVECSAPTNGNVRCEACRAKNIKRLKARRLREKIYPGMFNKGTAHLSWIQ